MTLLETLNRQRHLAGLSKLSEEQYAALTEAKRKKKVDDEEEDGKEDKYLQAIFDRADKKKK